MLQTTPPPINSTSNKLADCPKWIRFLEDAVGSDNSLLLQNLIGEMLDDNAPKKMLCFHGSKASGKTLLANTIVRLIGESKVSRLNTHIDDTVSERLIDFYRLQKVKNIIFEAWHPKDIEGVINIKFNAPKTYDRNLNAALQGESIGILNWIRQGHFASRASEISVTNEATIRQKCISASDCTEIVDIVDLFYRKLGDQYQEIFRVANGNGEGDWWALFCDTKELQKWIDLFAKVEELKPIVFKLHWLAGLWRDLIDMCCDDVVNRLIVAKETAEASPHQCVKDLANEMFGEGGQLSRFVNL